MILALQLDKGAFTPTKAHATDAGYTGSIKIALQWLDDKCNQAMFYTFERGERIAQLVIVPIPEIELQEVSELPQTDRGSNGFGSSGK